jgi:glutathione-regulated potassium-efflux system protein KefB
VRSRDAERFALEVASGGYEAGMKMLFRNAPGPALKPVPLSAPRRDGKALNPLPAADEPPPQSA